jgi:hypothetical protein
MGLTPNQLSWLEFYLDAGDRIGYYTALSLCGEKYGALARGVVDAENLMGGSANMYFSNYVEAQGISLSTDTLAQISLDLMEADYAARSTGADVGWEEIQLYHNNVFAAHGISADAWTPNIALNALDTVEKKAELWDDIMDAGPVGSYASIVGAVFTAEGITYSAAAEYLYELTSAGVAGATFDSNELGMYDVTLSNGNHVIGHDHTPGTVNGYAGTDVIMGFDGADHIDGQEGNDFLYGGLGNDYVFGGDGSDELSDGDGEDVLEGGAGDNYYYLTDDDEADIIVMGESGAWNWVENGSADDRIVFRADLAGPNPSSQYDSNPSVGFSDGTTAIPLLGGFIYETDIYNYVSAGYHFATEGVEVSYFENPEGPPSVEYHVEETGVPLWDEMVDIDHTTPEITNMGSRFGVGYEGFETPDGNYQLTVSIHYWLDGEQATSEIVIWDYEPGDFGIKFAELDTYTIPSEDGGGELKYAGNDLQILHINNFGEYVDVPERDLSPEQPFLLSETQLIDTSNQPVKAVDRTDTGQHEAPLAALNDGNIHYIDSHRVANSAWDEYDIRFGTRDDSAGQMDFHNAFLFESYVQSPVLSETSSSYWFEPEPVDGLV